MRGPGRPDSYSHYISALDNEGLYSADGVIRHAEVCGLIPADLAGEELSDHLRNGVHAMVMRGIRKLKEPADGIDRLDPANPKEAYLGIRWKTTIPTRYLEEEDGELVARFRDDEQFRNLFMTSRKKEQTLTWRHYAGAQARNTEGQQQHWFSNTMVNTMLIGLLLFVPLLYFLIKNDPREQIEELSNKSKAEALRTLLSDPDRKDFRLLLLSRIAECYETAGKPVPILQDMSRLSAVFAFPDNPVLLFDFWIVRLGDRMTMAGEHGFVTEINRKSFLLMTVQGTREYVYPELRIFGALGWRNGQILIYPSENNLFRILNAMSVINGYSLEPQQVSGYLAGSFDCEDYNAFLTRIAPDLGIHIQGDHIDILELPKGRLRSYLGFDHFFPFRTTTVADVFNEYKYQFKVNMIIKGIDQSSRLIFPPTQLHQFITALSAEVQVMSPTLFLIRPMR